jgi:16S rRNA (guanine(1405)-N(7))-methyltransferase
MTEADAKAAREIVRLLSASRKYRTIVPEAIETIALGELRRHGKLKDALKATKNKLHQVAAAYIADRPDYDAWLEELRRARPSPEAWRETCRAIMRAHASTRERLPILETFFDSLLADVAPVRSVLDLACGLNPLAIPWMPLAAEATYVAHDIYEDMMRFIGRFLDLAGVRGESRACDTSRMTSFPEVDVAYLLKAVPCLDPVDKHPSGRLLDLVPARHVIVSFPAQSLGGARSWDRSTYVARFEAVVRERDWAVRRFDFATELAFRITKPG